MTADLILSPIPVRPCIKCGEPKRNKKGDCKACARIYGAAWRAANPSKAKAAEDAWRAANPDRVKANNAAWRKANPEKAKAIVAAYRARNPEKGKVAGAAWQKANPEKVRAKSAVWRKANLEKARAMSKAWAKANPEARRIIQQNRDARKNKTEGRLSKGLVSKLFKLQKGMCPCCKQPLGDNFHIDHVTPLARGGGNVDSNMQLLRAVCNMAKSAKDPLQFMQSRGFLI